MSRMGARGGGGKLSRCGGSDVRWGPRGALTLRLAGREGCCGPYGVDVAGADGLCHAAEAQRDGGREEGRRRLHLDLGVVLRGNRAGQGLR